MAVSAASLRSDFSGFLPVPIAAPIFERAARMSVVQRLAHQVALGDRGSSIPVVTGRMGAGWVDEAAQKPASAGSMALKTITPKKLAAIAVVSAETVRANPGNYMNILRPQIAEAFAVAFDYAALYDLGPDGTGTGPFATYIAQTTKEQELGTSSAANGGIYKDLVNALSEVIGDAGADGRRYRFSGWALDDLVEPMMLGQVDTTGRPVWVDLPTDDVAAGIARPGRVLGRASFMGEGVANPNGTVVGFGGDFAGQTAWGVVGGINFDVSTEATVTINGTLTSLWEHNLLAIRAEAEYGWLVNDPEAFIQLLNETS